jgi:large subunit ribosomal protein L25
VPVKFTGQETSPGIRRGGMLNIVRHEIDLVCAVESIPDLITVSLEGLDIGDSIHIGAISLPGGARPAITRNFTVASIAAPTAVREEQAAAAAATAAAEAATAAGVPAEGEAAAPAAPGAAAPAAGAPAAAPAAGAPARQPGGKS